MQIAVAQPGKGGAQQHLAPGRLFQRDVLDRQRLVRRCKTAALMAAPLSSAALLSNLFNSETMRSQDSSITAGFFKNSLQLPLYASEQALPGPLELP
jgi:hypothetical protein